MPIVEFSNLNRYGNVRTRRFWKDKSNLNINPNGLGPSISYNLFKYEYRHPITPPGLVRLGRIRQFQMLLSWKLESSR